MIIAQKTNPNYKAPWYPFSTIKITSPEQFVPLYLAYSTPTTVPEHDLGAVFWSPSPATVRVRHSSLLRLQRIKRAVEDGDDLDHEVATANVENIIREEMMSILDHPYPSEYGFPVPQNAIVGTYLAAGGDLHKITALDAFTRGYFANDPFRIVGPGVIIRMAYAPYVNMTTNAYLGVQVMSRSWYKDANVVLLLLIKAKLIPKVRARLYLGLPLELNMGDVRLLRGPAIDPRLEDTLRYMGNEVLNEFIRTTGVTEEWLSQPVMQSYLWPPKPMKTNQQLVRDTIEAAERLRTVPELI